MIEVQLTLFEEYTDGECYCCHRFGYVNDITFYELDSLLEVRSFCTICVPRLAITKDKSI